MAITDESETTKRSVRKLLDERTVQIESKSCTHEPVPGIRT